MTIALVGVTAVALIGFIGELIAEVLIEVVGQLVFEIFVEGLGWGFRRADRDPASTNHRPDGKPRPRERSGVLRWPAAIVVGLAFGIWRGLLTDTVTWGFGLAAVVAVAAVVAARVHRPIERPDGRWRQLLMWWPSDRLYWFAVANAAFVVGYLIAVV